MKAVDTNILVRLLVQDDEKQAARVNQLLTDAETRKQPLFVSHVVVLELIWVLGSAYEIPREEILKALSHLLSMAALTFQAPPTIRDFINNAQAGSLDLADLLIAQIARDAGCETTLTFDNKAARANLFSKL
ncbi:MAG TPA: PIN domain-containing protein [Gammaproteobacteria bacterium]|nr:PIN domain-containing protein [Gammaproteobacteria bacterium]